MPQPLHEQARPSLGVTRVARPKVGYTWVGIAALASIGALAVIYGREHEEESKRRKRALQARGG